MAAGAGALRLARAAVAVLQEGTPFTESEPPSPGIMCYDVAMDFGDENNVRTDYSNHFGKLAELSGARWGKLSFKQAMLTGGTAGTLPYNHLIVAAAGHRVTKNGTTDVTSVPWTTITTDTGTIFYPHQVSFALWEDGIKYRFKGGCGTGYSMVWEMGKPPYWEFAFQGAFVQTEDEAMGTVVTSSVAPVQFIGASVITIDTADFALTSFRVDSNHSAGKLLSVNDTNGIVGFVQTDRRLTFKCDPSMELKANYDFFDKWKTSASLAINITMGTAANRITFDAARAQWHPPKPSAREMIRSMDMEGSIISAGTEGDDYTLKFD